MSVRPFDERYAAALADSDVRAGLTAFQRGWRDNRDQAIASLEQQEGRSFDELRAELAAIKDGVIADWSTYLDRFEANATAAGAEVTRVSTPGEANAHITSLIRRPAPAWSSRASRWSRRRSASTSTSRPTASPRSR
ncbi:MAG: hypothetical protein ACOC9I_02440, partial [Actinomycetota bacterium]